MAVERPPETPPRASIPFDYLSVAEELHSGRIKVSSDAAAAEYLAVERDIEVELKALMKDTETGGISASSCGPSTDEPSVEMLPVEPEAVARELGLAGSDPAELGRLRRIFALKNHPDRVPPQLRERALQRMQIANGLIDAAKRKALAKSRL